MVYYFLFLTLKTFQALLFHHFALRVWILGIEGLGSEYVFLSAGKFMPGMEKLTGELFFPTNQQLFLTTEGSKNSWF